MAEPGTFYQPGYYDENGNFIGAPLRARDSVASNGVNAEEHITDAGIHLTLEQAGKINSAVQSSALFGADGKVLESKLPKAALTASDLSVENIPALLALDAAEAPLNTDVFVGDATADATVGSGWAMYRRMGLGTVLTDWKKLSEGESLDVTLKDQSARDAAAQAQAAATNAKTAADTAQSTADTAKTNAATAQTAANNAASAAGSAMIEARLTDAAVCASEADMAAKNLRAGAFVLMRVTNA